MFCNEKTPHLCGFQVFRKHLIEYQMKKGIENMYRLVIADDESRTREGIMNGIDWNELGFIVTETFADGQELIEYLDCVVPDVILTDIKMNYVSGIDVAKYVFENKLPCKVVLISGFQEFELALQGIKYGVDDYLLKPTDVDKVEETFIKIKKQLDERYAQFQKTKSERQRMDEALSLLDERFFADIVMGVVENGEYVRSCMGVLYPEVDVENTKSFLANIYIEDYEQFMEEVWEYGRDQFEINIGNFLKIFKNDYCFHVVYKENELIELLGLRIENKTKGSQEEEQALKNLLLELEQVFGFRAKGKVRGIYDNIDQIGKANEQDLMAEVDEKELIQYLNEQKKLIMSNISIGKIITAQKLYHNILEELDKLKYSWQRRNNVVIDIMSTMNTVLWETNKELAKSIQPFLCYTKVLSMTKIQEIKAWSDRIFDQIKLADLRSTNRGGSLVERAKDYICENIYKDISQEETANYLYICPSYLSRIFRKQTGESFLQYVTRIKMEKAIELLKEPQYKTYQVGEMLGYKTPRYFARLFRAHTGMNPGEYRSKMLHLGEEYEENK